MLESSSEKPLKLGIKIEKPVDVGIHAIYILFLFFSFLLIGLTIWLLVLEYLGESPPTWLRALLENFALTF